jgi:hypothetical protein
MTARARQLMLAGAIDSVGLAFGWTVFNLIAVYKHGLAVTALLNVAMFLGVALSAPVAARLTGWLDGRRTLQATAGLEALLRVGTLALLYWGAPLSLLFALVLVMNVAAWIGFAGMRTEVAATGAGASGMTRYLAMTLGLEAVGTSLAAMLPITTHGLVSADWLVVAFATYGLSLLPTVLVATKSTVSTRQRKSDGGLHPNRRLFVAGAVLMAVGSGPTLLFVGLSARLHGRESVVGAALAFAVGSLISPRLTRALDRVGVVGLAGWPLWCVVMVAGWAAAPWSVAGLWLAQLLSGAGLTAFQGAMDDALAGQAADGDATTALAQGSAARAVGSAVAVRLVPVFGIAGAFAGFTLVGAAAGFLLATALVRDWSSRGIQAMARPADA